MKTYPITIRKPFDTSVPLEKIKKGDIGVYVKHITRAKREFAILEITTPKGITYADPKKVMKDKRIIYRYYLKPEPMMLYVITPKYDNKSDFEDDKGWTEEGRKKMLEAMRQVLNKT